MFGVCQDTEGQWFVCNSPFSEATEARMVTDTNPTRGGTTNNLGLAILLTQVIIFAPNMDTLAHTRTAVDNTEAKRWSNRRSVISATAVGTILRYLALLTQNHKIYSSVQRISGTDNNMADAASRLTHLTNKILFATSPSPFHRESLGGFSPFRQGAGGG